MSNSEQAKETEVIEDDDEPDEWYTLSNIPRDPKLQSSKANCGGQGQENFQHRLFRYTRCDLTLSQSIPMPRKLNW